MNALEIMRVGSNILRDNRISSHILDSEILLSKTLNQSKEEVLINLDQKINTRDIIKFKKYLSRRSLNEPMAYILKEKEFWSKKFYVNKHTLIPRPETELLIDKLLKMFHGKKISVLDIGTGSGCIVISLLDNLTRSIGLGIDISKNAISVARKNAKKHKLSKRVSFTSKSYEYIFNKKFDLIVSNPPYIERKNIKNLSNDIKNYEPRMALDGGNDGLDLIKKIIYKSKDILKVNGTLALEIGNGQFRKVSNILIDNKFRIKHVIKDYKNNVRCVFANYN